MIHMTKVQHDGVEKNYCKCSIVELGKNIGTDSNRKTGFLLF